MKQRITRYRGPKHAGVSKKTFTEACDDFRLAFNGLLQILAKELGICKILDYLANKIDKRGE